ncbi:MAG: shikimate kinase [Hydrogenobacter sp.]|uniref:shikimate kinase n=1 Tax=Hydrogenobacter thermophilus TaxID=940 RepID=UPI0030F8E70E
MRFKRIFLIGFMGSGKTTVGKLLSERLGWKFYDLDQEIEKEEGMSIREIFQIKGESYFRDKELNLLKRLIPKEATVISTGGGLGANREALGIMKKYGFVVWLDVSFESFLQRCAGTEERPLLKKSCEELRDIYEKRKNVYSEAHLRVSAEKEPQKIVDEIIQNISS